MGELCREMGDGTEDPDPFCMAGMRLPFYVVVYHLGEIVLVFLGWNFFSNIQVGHWFKDLCEQGFFNTKEIERRGVYMK